MSKASELWGFYDAHVDALRDLWGLNHDGYWADPHEWDEISPLNKAALELAALSFEEMLDTFEEKP